MNQLEKDVRQEVHKSFLVLSEKINDLLTTFRESSVKYYSDVLEMDAIDQDEKNEETRIYQLLSNRVNEMGRELDTIREVYNA